MNRGDSRRERPVGTRTCPIGWRRGDASRPSALDCLWGAPVRHVQRSQPTRPSTTRSRRENNGDDQEGWRCLSERRGARHLNAEIRRGRFSHDSWRSAPCFPCRAPLIGRVAEVTSRASTFVRTVRPRFRARNRLPDDISAGGGARGSGRNELGRWTERLILRVDH